MTFIEKWDLVIDAWMTRVVNEQNKHERLAIKSMRLHYGLGIPSVSIAAISGTSVLIEMATASLAAKVVVGLSGLTVSVLTGIQTFAQLAGLAERHRLTAIRCKSLLRQLEINKTYPPKTRDEARNRMLQLHGDFSDMEKDAPITHAMLRELPTDNRLKAILVSLAMDSPSITDLGFRLWSVAAATIDDQKNEDGGV